MGSQETWEILLLPVGKVAGGGMASVNNIDPGPSGTCGAGWRTNKPKDARSRKS